MQTQRARQTGRPQRNSYARPRARAGLLATPHMDFGGIEHVESIMFAEGITLAPMSWQAKSLSPLTPMGSITVMPTARAQDIGAGRLDGVVIPGSGCADDPESIGAFDEVINSAISQQMPVMAFGEGVSEMLRALGYEPPRELPPGLLLHEGFRILETAEEVRDAAMVFHGGSPNPSAH
ncbi:hypothetical protein [Phenylobacterium sp.]|uniref:hypothetical protein n=1 Tax=Phenylobacterium sp. TaxID=1871053 RepID=UPI0030F37B55